MNREEAISLIREIDEECKGVRGRSIILVPPDENDPFAKGYQVQVKMAVTSKKLVCLGVIAEESGLGLRSEPGRELLTIFTPKRKGDAFKSKEDTSGSASA